MPDIIVMFFLLGVVAGSLKSDLAIPKAAYDILSLMLMLTIGLKGGMALHGNLHWGLVVEILAVTSLGILIPLALFPVLRYVVRLKLADAASFAAHYGSVSAGTFAVALAWVEARGLATGGQVTLYLVLLELPAILTGLWLYRRLGNRSGVEQRSGPALWQETLTNRSVVLLVGGLVIGILYGPDQGEGVTAPLTGAFSLVLALFLLEMGLVAADTLQKLRWQQWRVIAFALLMPPILAVPGLLTGLWLGLAPGTVVILGTLTASASYIAAPVAIRHSVPEADVGLTMLASLGVTFPFNVLVGIGLYSWLAENLNNLS
ncbi:sodium-dependent bicarbonate transport family permease [Marinobacter sp. CHS3-4]|uniref:sodium-dependent bicarbonate transport family permease n=1 Tax=Marinobacter sp. CHS3-4 TaxID=3045174 RepID=UPI0024B55351|nr:sodium-dependent bicarbonate transport family permease [Marinobacter sp. CHS3-4]MDI9243819.1 sodium-dependent bicarbonate transport family permease [Marinobacter sp. CHS3-4]